MDYMGYNHYLANMLTICLCLCVLLTLANSALQSKELRKLKGKQNLLLSEIEVIKDKLWTDIIPEIEEIKAVLLSENVSEKVSIDGCQSMSTRNEDAIVSDEDQRKIHTIVIKHEKLTSIILKTVHDQKKMMLSNLQNLNNQMTYLMEEIKQVRVYNKEERAKCQNEILNTDLKLSDIKDTLAQLALNQKEIRGDLEYISETVTEKESPDYTFNKPSFISEWILMKSQDAELSEVTVAHGLGVIPYKVEVQITPTKGPNIGYIFQGTSAFQSDDDIGKHYGGVVYFYNESHVLLLAPNKNNQKDAGRILYTGQSDSMYQGNHHEIDNEALVRVKVWSPSDLPEPSFASEWQPLDSGIKELTYYDIEHGLEDYPVLVSVQVDGDTKPYGYLVSDGVGSSIELHDKWSSHGGVLWAVGKKSIRVWTRFSEDNVGLGLFGGGDGWGRNRGINLRKARVRVLSWSKKHFTAGGTLQEDQSTVVHLVSIPSGVNIDTDHVSFFVHANDGNNKGYRFYCTGNSQAIGKPYGGAIFAYNTFYNFRTWLPNSSQSGYMVHVLESYGAGVNSQASNNVTYGAIVMKAH